MQEFLHLQRIVSSRFGCRVDRGEAAADDRHRQPQLHVGDRILLGGAGELQRHEEVGSGAHARRQTVGNVEHRGAPRTRSQHHVIEPEIEGVVDRKRAAEAHPSEQREFLTALQQQPYEFQEVLVPAYRDAVFGHSAEAGHDAIVQRFEQRFGVEDRLERDPRAGTIHSGLVCGQRLDLQAVYADHAMAVVHQMMRHGESGRPHAGDQHAPAAGGAGERPAQVERVPAREQAVDLESPGQFQYVLQAAGFRLRDVDRLLLLVDAGFHAVVADTVPGGGNHGVVHHDHRQRADRDAFGLELLEFGNALFQRTARQRHAENRCLELRCATVRGGFLLQSVRTGIAALLVAPDAIVGLIERAD